MLYKWKSSITVYKNVEPSNNGPDLYSNMLIFIVGYEEMKKLPTL